MAEQASTEPDATSEPGADEEHGAPPEVRDAFQAALARKRQGQGDSHAGGGPRGSGKVADAHSAAGGRRQFRRKSGG